MNGVLKKVLTWFILPVIIVLLVLAIVDSIMQPVNFNKQKAFREDVAIQRLKDIRTLEVEYKGATGHFTADIDSLIGFFKNGEMTIMLQIGSMDDSLAVEHTAAIKRKNSRITPAQLYDMYLAGDKNLVFNVENKIPVRDTLFSGREGFCVDSLRTIPFSDGAPVEMDAVTRMVSGVPVSLFEAKMPYRLLLKGLDNQLRINLDAEKRAQNRYEGLQVGSVTAPNNNAGNWE